MNTLPDIPPWCEPAEFLPRFEACWRRAGGRLLQRVHTPDRVVDLLLEPPIGEGTRLILARCYWPGPGHPLGVDSLEHFIEGIRIAGFIGWFVVLGQRDPACDSIAKAVGVELWDPPRLLAKWPILAELAPDSRISGH